MIYVLTDSDDGTLISASHSRDALLAKAVEHLTKNCTLDEDQELGFEPEARFEAGFNVWWIIDLNYEKKTGVPDLPWYYVTEVPV